MRRIMVPALQNFDNSSNNTIANHSTTPTRPSRSRRPPLQARDHNAMMRVPPKPPPLAKSGGSGNHNNNMPPHDKQNVSRPLMPALSASAARSANRPPMTPRVAAGSAPAAISTPPLSRTPRLENKIAVGSREDHITTPVASFLNHNITPRSGSRKSRVDSASTTPNGTPTGTPVDQYHNDTFRISPDPPLGLGLRTSGLERDVTKRPTVSFSPAVSDLGSSRAPVQSNPGDSKFFFASDAKTTQPSRPPLPQPKGSSFFYANGDAIPTPPQIASISAAGSTVGEDRPQPRPFYSGGTPDSHASSLTHFPAPRPGSVVSSASRMTSPHHGNASPGALSPPQRPISPSKLNHLASMVSPRNSPSLPSPPVPRPQPPAKGQTTNNVPIARRASIEGQRIMNHGRSASVASDSGRPHSRKASGGFLIEPTVPFTPLTLITSSVPVSTPEEINEGTAKDDKPPELQSPTKSGHSLEHMNELAANARRERKVLDLEITNSSLTAINRTLEREMRKQTAELRRYRRLSRSGRLSIATTASIRSSSGTLCMGDGSEGTPLSDMSEEEDSADESDFSDGSMDDGSRSPRAMEESDLRHRKRDEERLQLDLSKHQQLLVDSQKMNQSLKRCLGWSEAMITEGKKALEYNVRVSDVEIGGRVLPPDEIEEEIEETSECGVQILREARLAASNGTPTWVGLGKDDRDSGIELDSAHPVQMKTLLPTPLPLVTPEEHDVS